MVLISGEALQLAESMMSSIMAKALGSLSMLVGGEFSSKKLLELKMDEQLPPEPPEEF